MMKYEVSLSAERGEFFVGCEKSRMGRGRSHLALEEGEKMEEGGGDGLQMIFCSSIKSRRAAIDIQRFVSRTSKPRNKSAERRGED